MYKDLKSEKENKSKKFAGEIAVQKLRNGTDIVQRIHVVLL